jgi:hypothetical protein
MIPENIYNSLYCVYGNKNTHFVEEAVRLECGHSVCKKCIYDSDVQCNVCDKMQQVKVNDLERPMNQKKIEIIID